MSTPRGKHGHTGKPVQAWEDDAECGRLVRAGLADPEDWTCDDTPANRVRLERAVVVCGQCPVRLECGQWARDEADGNEPTGVLGGLLARDRTRLRTETALVAS
jgi:hypothetical protein